MIILPEILAAIKRMEGFSRHIYPDSGGVRTTGYGTTEADIKPLPDPISEPVASALLIRSLQRKYGPYVDALNLPNPYMQGACLSIAYNCGPGILGPGYSLGRALIARDYALAARLFGLYIHDSKGRVEPGLVTRRAWEAAYFQRKWVDPDPYGYRRFDRRLRHLDGRVFSEEEVVPEYDRKRRHPKIWKGRLRRLRADCNLLAERLESRYVQQHNRWVGDQKWRHDQLVRRAKGDRVAG